jgi:UPF0755 protein
MRETEPVTSPGVFVLAAIHMHLARLWLLYASLILAAGLIGAMCWSLFFAVPPDFPRGKIITIPEGAAAPLIANQLENAGVIRSAFVFQVLARLRGGASHMQSGKYVFAEPVGVFRIEERIQDGAHGIVASRVVFPEGATARDMARIAKEALPDFDADGFLAEAIPLEGFLFPDTYFFYPDVTPHEVIVRMYGNFSDQIATLDPEVTSFDRPLRDDLIMASLLEKEARSLADKRMVAGILWNRIARGMPLQVDAVFGYINDRATYSPSFTDLETQSLYNTYIHKGLPPGPIGNPGLDSILAAVTPATTTALYYLTGRDGQMHYANTFAGHKANREKYLD